MQSKTLRMRLSCRGFSFTRDKPYDLHNAYVGGDAYNYIINGNYATACFVLATMFVIIGFGVLVFAYLKQAYSEPTVKNEPTETETPNFQVEETLMRGQAK